MFYNLLGQMKVLVNILYFCFQKSSVKSEPFVRAYDPHPSNVIVTKLSRIQNQLLRKEDPLLHEHLTRLEILPQVYGMYVPLCF